MQSLLTILNAEFAGLVVVLFAALAAILALSRFAVFRARPLAAMTLAIFIAAPSAPVYAVVDNTQKADNCVTLTRSGGSFSYRNQCGRTINVIYCFVTTGEGNRCNPNTRMSWEVNYGATFINSSFFASGECFAPFWPVNISVDYNARQVNFDCDDGVRTGGSGGGGGGGGSSGLAIGLGAAALIGIGIYALNSDGDLNGEESAFSIQPLASYAYDDGSESLGYGMRMSYREDSWGLWWLSDASRLGWGGEWRGDWLRAEASAWESADTPNLRAGLGMEWTAQGWRLRPSFRLRTESGAWKSGADLRAEWAREF